MGVTTIRIIQRGIQTIESRPKRFLIQFLYSRQWIQDQEDVSQFEGRLKGEYKKLNQDRNQSTIAMIYGMILTDSRQNSSFPDLFDEIQTKIHQNRF